MSGAVEAANLYFCSAEWKFCALNSSSASVISFSALRRESTLENRETALFTIGTTGVALAIGRLMTGATGLSWPSPKNFCTAAAIGVAAVGAAAAAGWAAKSGAVKDEGDDTYVIA